MKVVEITDSNFENLVIDSDKPVLVKFTADWCPSCMAMRPIIENLAIETQGQAIVGELDVDANPIRTEKYGIRSIPTMLIFVNGVVMEKLVGPTAQYMMLQKLQQAAGAVASRII